MLVKDDCRYTKDHEWIKIDGDYAYIGITDYAQDELGEIVYVEFLKDLDDEVEAGEEFASVESTKSTSDVLTPVSGVVIEYNSAVEDDSEIINSSPYDEGWIVKLKISDRSEFDQLMNSKEYEEFLSTLS